MRSFFSVRRPLCWPPHRADSQHRLHGLFRRDSCARQPAGGRGLLDHAKLCLPAALSQQFGEALPLDQLHAIEVSAIFDAEFMHRHNMRMLQGGGGPGLVAKPLQLLAGERTGQREQFQSDPAAKRDLFRLVDNPHPPAADLMQQPVITDLFWGF